MTRDVKLSDLSEELEDLSYPIEHDDAVDRLDDVVLVYADGEEPLPDVLGRSSEDVFDNADALQNEILTLVPTEAVGEPGQSEGEGDD